MAADTGTRFADHSLGRVAARWGPRPEILDNDAPSHGPRLRVLGR